jgi:hypothetical protein
MPGQLRKTLLAAGGVALLAAAGCAHSGCCGGQVCQPCDPESVGPAGYCGEIPRFHPVPTQPVFAPRAYAVAVYPQPAGAEVLPPGLETPTPSGKPSSGSGPSTLPPPLGEPSKSPAEPAAPRQLDLTANTSGSWVFAPPLPAAALRNAEPSVEVKSDTPDKAAGQRGAKP